MCHQFNLICSRDALSGLQTQIDTRPRTFNDDVREVSNHPSHRDPRAAVTVITHKHDAHPTLFF